MKAPLFDAHCHLHHEPIAGRWESVWREMQQVGCGGAIVNGTDTGDWDDVAAFVEQHDWATPAFGVHPWRIDHVHDHWLNELREHLTQLPGALVGEIGLDRARKGLDQDRQEAMFGKQFALAAEMDRPCCVHCVKTHGHLVELIEPIDRPTRWIMHGYSGSAEMVERFVRLGAYLSFSPATLGRAKVVDALRATPIDRVLMETDAPYMPAGESMSRFEIPGRGKARWSHPANLIVAYETAADLLGTPMPALAERVSENFGAVIA